jgi:hypothetical protein
MAPSSPFFVYRTRHRFYQLRYDLSNLICEFLFKSKRCSNMWFDILILTVYLITKKYTVVLLYHYTYSIYILQRAQTVIVL